MGRHGYSDDCDDTLALGRWRAQVKSATRGKRGQAFFKELVEALDAMPAKRLITEDLVKNGEFCTLGAIGAKRGVDLEAFEPDDHDGLAAQFGIAHQLIQEVEYENDEGGPYTGETPEQRWSRMRAWAESQVRAQTEGGVAND